MKRPRIFPRRPARASRRRRALGQHFLTDPRAAARILSAFEPRRGEVVVEVGPGRGVLTARLLEAGVRLVAIEKDESLAGELEARWPGEERLRIVRGDARSADLEELLRPWLPAGRRSRARVLANLPYSVGGQILAGLLQSSPLLESLTVLLQKEVVDRICSGPGSRRYGSLSVLAQYFTEPRAHFTVPPGAFSPPPKVTSALVTLPFRRKRELSPEMEAAYPRFARQLFSARRRTLPHNLKALLREEPPAIADKLSGIGIEPRRRPETLTRSECLEIFEMAVKTAGDVY